MSNTFTTGQTTLRSDNRANTFVHTTTIRASFDPPPEQKPRFSWGFNRDSKPGKPTDRQQVKTSGKPGKRKRGESAPDPIPVRTVTTFQAKAPEQLIPPRDSVTRLSARVSPNTRPMYTADEFRNIDAVKPASPVRASFGKGASGDGTVDENFKPLRFGERMLRNTAVCVAVLLCALAIKTVDAPIARTVSAELRDWVTMDLDESLGSLKFVQNLLPDAALVFWHIGSRQTFAQPSQAVLSHSWNENEPYLAYTSALQTPVFAAAAGEVAAITYLDDTTITVRLRHDDGMETVYGNLESCTVREGDLVGVSDILGASGTLYFEIRGEGRSMNPAPLMAAQQP